MKVAVLSGKGGTGKTLVSVNLASVLGMEKARVAAEAGAKTADGLVSYVDCDVEEPNGRLFLKPVDVKEEDVSVKIPLVNKELCNGCRKCVSFCKFNALALIKDKVLVFDEVCHSCGGCEIVCPEGAISEKERVIGHIEKGRSQCQGEVNVFTGILNTGEVSGVPVIRQLLKDSCISGGSATGDGDCTGDVDRLNDVVIDCPPGCACVVMESIRDADFCILVAEPTIFGAHNLEMVYDLVQMFGKKFGVVLNKCIDGENPSEQFCIDHNIQIIGRIPFDKKLGLVNSNGGIITRESERYKGIFQGILENVRNNVSKISNREVQ